MCTTRAGRLKNSVAAISPRHIAMVYGGSATLFAEGVDNGSVIMQDFSSLFAAMVDTLVSCSGVDVDQSPFKHSLNRLKSSVYDMLESVTEHMVDVSYIYSPDTELYVSQTDLLAIRAQPDELRRQLCEIFDLIEALPNFAKVIDYDTLSEVVELLLEELDDIGYLELETVDVSGDDADADLNSIYVTFNNRPATKLRWFFTEPQVPYEYLILTAALLRKTLGTLDVKWTIDRAHS